MTTIIIIIVLIVIGKFIYDSYLTNNTEKTWSDYKKSNSTIVSNSNSNDKEFIAPNCVSFEGYYQFNYKGFDINNNPLEFMQLLLFIDNKYVCIIEPEGNPKAIDKRMKLFMSKIKESLKAIKSDEYNHLDSSLGIYKIYNNKIEIKFFDPKDKDNSDIDNPQVYKKLYGILEKNKLVLNQLDRIYDFSKGGFKEAEIDLLKDSKFYYCPL